MNSRLFWKSLAVQAAAVLVLFGVLVALPLPDDFFEDFGFIVGPLAWIACSVLTARVVQIPLAFALFAAVAGGVAGTIVLVVASHCGGHGRRAAGVRRLVRRLRPCCGGTGHGLGSPRQADLEER